MGNTVIWKPAVDPAARGPPDHGAARGGRPAAGRHQHAPRRRASTSPRSRSPTPTWPASTSPARPAIFQHLWQTVGANIASLPLLPAHRRRDRRQGLRGRPPQRRPRRAAHGADPRRLRVPGPEVLGRLARVRRAVGVGEDARPVRRRGRGPDHGRRHRPLQLHGRGDRRPGVRQAQGGDHARQAQQPRSSILAGGQTDDSVGYFVRPTVVESHATRRTQMFTTEYFGPILAVHVYDDAATTGSCSRWSRSRRTP